MERFVVSSKIVNAVKINDTSKSRRVHIPLEHPLYQRVVYSDGLVTFTPLETSVKIQLEDSVGSEE